MYIVLIVTLVCGGVLLPWAAASKPAVVVWLEGAGGALFIAGLLLIGLALPAVQPLGHK